METLAFVTLTYLLVKHFICDFPIQVQPPWMFLNKGTYGHPGGIAHSLVHALATVAFVLGMQLCSWPIALAIGILEWIIHYHMDWWKMWWGKRNGYKADTHSEFWFWLGIDQLVHGLTYVLILVILF
jgi:hypothetical protein